jgi:hypothetical protein
VLSPSDIADFDACGYKHALRRHGVKAESTAAALLFGTTGHSCVQHHVIGLVTDRQLPAYFDQLWQKARRENVIRYSSIESFDTLRAIGMKLMERFPEWWKQSGFRPVRMPDNEYAVEKRLAAQLSPTVILSTQPDLIVEVTRTMIDKAGNVMAKPGDVGILDVKTPRAESTVPFSQRSIQLTLGKVAVDGNKPTTGLSKDVSSVGYVELLKKKSPSITRPFLYPRPAHLVQDAIHKAISVAARIRKGDYCRTTGMAFNSPCNMCEFEGLCYSGSDEGLILPAGMTADELQRRQTP